MSSFFEINQKELQQFAGLSQTIGKRADYVQGGGGNTSVKLHGGLMAIKASGFKLSDIKEKNGYAVLDFESVRKFYYGNEPGDLPDVESTGTAVTKSTVTEVEGLEQLRPSVEAGFHSLLDTFVIHSHSVYANLAACAKEAKQIISSALKDAPYTWGYVPYTDPGIRLTFSIRDELSGKERETNRKPNVIFMQNHGLIVTHEDADECVKLHADVNKRIAASFGLRDDAFPEVKIKDKGNGLYASDTAYLKERLLTGKYDEAFFTEHSLYPDQIVFLNGTLFVTDKSLEQDTCKADLKSGSVVYRMNGAKAQTIEETLTAVIFIVENIERSGYTVSTMGDAAKSFIANWESEKYRKTLVGKR